MSGVLAGMRVIEGSAFVAMPLGGHDHGPARRGRHPVRPDRRRAGLHPLAGHPRRETQPVLGRLQQGQALARDRLPLSGGPGDPHSAHHGARPRLRVLPHQLPGARVAVLRRACAACARTWSWSTWSVAATGAPRSTTRSTRRPGCRSSRDRPTSTARSTTCSPRGTASPARWRSSGCSLPTGTGGSPVRASSCAWP